MFGGNNMPYYNMFARPSMMGTGMFSPFSQMNRGMVGAYSPFGRGMGSLASMGMGRGASALGGGVGNAGRLGLFGRLTSLNWSSLITNTGKTLDVVNRAIPIVKQTGPMVNNMKTMFKLAGAFKDESRNSSSSDTLKSNITKTSTDTRANTVETVEKETATSQVKTDSLGPNFFI